MVIDFNIKSTQFVHFINKQDDNRSIAGKVGAIEAIVKAMNTHINNANLCENGCGALTNIAINGNLFQHQKYTIQSLYKQTR